MPGLLIFLALAVGLLLAGLEWRRPDRRHRWWRIAATFAAIVALVIWGVRRTQPEKAELLKNADAILWTATENAVDISVPAEIRIEHCFALPDAKQKATDALVVPDVAYIRRHHPEISRLRIRGAGLEAYELETLQDLGIEFVREPEATLTPAISFAELPREVALGEQVQIHGSVAGLGTGETARLALTAPDGSNTEATCSADDSRFVIAAAGPRAEGRFVYRLKMMAGDDARVVSDEQFGVAVVTPNLPRVLALESSPRFETAHLQRWYGEIGGVLRARTRIGQDRYRFASSDESAVEFRTIDAELLAQFDLLVIDLRALGELSAEEGQAVRTTVSEKGLGLLLVVGGERSWPERWSDFLPWRLSATASNELDPEGEARRARLQWGDLPAPLETAVPVESFSFEAGPEALIRDSQNRPLVSAVQHGRGEVALSLVRETWRWRLENQPAVFAQYWSFLFSRLAKKQADDAGRWTIADPTSAPLFIDRPIELFHTGSRDRGRPGEVVYLEDGERAVLPLAQDEEEPQKWRGTFWPRRAGWHRVAVPEGEVHLDFFVHEPGAWASLAPARRRAATARFAALQKHGAQEAPAQAALATGNITRSTSALLFALFVLSSSYLWFERRGVTKRTAR